MIKRIDEFFIEFHASERKRVESIRRRKITTALEEVISVRKSGGDCEKLIKVLVDEYEEDFVNKVLKDFLGFSEKKDEKT